MFMIRSKNSVDCASTTIECEGGEIALHMYVLCEEVCVDLWVKNDSKAQVCDVLLYAGNISRLIECNGLYWQTETCDKSYSETFRLSRKGSTLEDSS